MRHCSWRVQIKLLKKILITRGEMEIKLKLFNDELNKNIGKYFKNHKKMSRNFLSVREKILKYFYFHF